MKYRPLISAALAGCAVTFLVTPASGAESQGELFDDFSYTGNTDPNLAEHDWTIRTGDAHIGVKGSTWEQKNVTFPVVSGTNRAMDLGASTQGTGGTTKQASVHNDMKYYRGTYGMRVKFQDSPTVGPDGDYPVQTAYTEGPPLKKDYDPDYSELDYEYTPNGGWNGRQDPTQYIFSYDTYRPDPWDPKYGNTALNRSMDGWHDLTINVTGNYVRYFIDGKQVAQHSQEYVPEVPMSIRFSQWLSGLKAQNLAYRRYDTQVDWVYHAKNETLTPDQVADRVDAFRADNVAYTDTVPTPPNAQSQTATTDEGATAGNDNPASAYRPEVGR